MPKIIILKIDDQTAVNGQVVLDYLFWLAVKPGREIPLPTFQSLWPGASEEQTADLQQGRVIERKKTRAFPVDLSSQEARELAKSTVIPGIKNLLVSEFTAAQATEDNRLSPLAFYGIQYDGENWSA